MSKNERKQVGILKTTAILLTLLLMLFLIPAEAETYTVSETVVIDVSKENFPSNDEMAEGFLNRAFYGEKTNLRKATAGTRLSEGDQLYYEKLKASIANVANGSETTTVFSFTYS